MNLILSVSREFEFIAMRNAATMTFCALVILFGGEKRVKEKERPFLVLWLLVFLCQSGIKIIQMPDRLTDEHFCFCLPCFTVHVKFAIQSVVFDF